MSGFDEVVGFYDPADMSVHDLLAFDAFQDLLNGTDVRPEFAATLIRCAYATVGFGPDLHSVVLFVLRFDETGRADAMFNMPLDYLAQQAGGSFEFDDGFTIRVACRSACPVPWHAVNLWEPAGSPTTHPLALLRALVLKNDLGLAPTASPQASGFDLGAGNADGAVIISEAPMLAPQPKPVPETPSSEPPLLAQRHELNRKLTETFGEQGRVGISELVKRHKVEMARARERFREDLAGQQELLLAQIRDLQLEIEELEQRLEREKKRSKRLQQLLRGEY